MPRILAALYFLLVTVSAFGQSVLSEGAWYRIAVTQEGIHRIDRSFLQSIGITSTEAVQLSLFGIDHEGMLPQSNDEASPKDLIELPLKAYGLSDGVMDASDYFLFYAHGPDRVQWTSSGLDYEKNLYSDSVYYFLTLRSNPKRIQQQSSLTEQPSRTTTFNDAIIHELDDRNLIRSGRIWYGEVFSTTTLVSRTFNFPTPGILQMEELEIQAYAQSQENCGFVVNMNGSEVGSFSLGSVAFGDDATYLLKARSAKRTYALNGPAENVDLEITYLPGGSPSTGLLDWFTITFDRDLRLYGDQTVFRSLDSEGQALTTFEIATNAPVEVWNITDPSEAFGYPISAVQGASRFTASTSTLEEFICLNPAGNFPQPIEAGAVANQNIQDLTGINGLIVTTPGLLSEAQRLAQFHQQNEGLSIGIVTTRQIYNEYSGGRQDISAIRNYVRHLWTELPGLRYLLLFGDGSYDYKYRVNVSNNLVPIYESRESFDPIYSYSSDDYFGFLEAGEGEWVESPAGDHSLDIGIGRIPVNTSEEARIVVDKIIRYCTSPKTLGSWRNDIVYIADDGDGNIHTNHAEELSTLTDTSSFYGTRKIYLDAYPQQVSPSFERSEQTRRAILDAFQKGSFFVDFIGHGNERLWMDEQVLTLPDIEGLTNFQKLPVFITATCEFGRYDNPAEQSGAELLLIRNKGAIALLTTSRPVFAFTNFLVNRSFHESLLIAGGKPLLGDIIMETKNNSLAGEVNRNFALLGDPFMSLAYPDYSIQLDPPITNDTDTLSALENITLEGSIRNELDQVVSDFDGVVEVSVWDTPNQKVTRGQQNLPFNYLDRRVSLFKGTATVINGVFAIHFTVPKNISYQNKPGRITMYASSESMNEDAAGVERSRIIGGTNKSAIIDTKPPEIYAYLNDSSFRNGSRVDASPLLIVQLQDENGINQSNLGFDGGITLELEGEKISLNEFFTASLDDFRRGTVLYPIQDLEPGTYTIRIKASDTYNNSTSQTVDFVVSDEPLIQIFSSGNFPNPASSYVDFILEHDREGEPLEISLSLYGLDGRVVNQTVYDIPFSERTVTFRLDFDGAPPENGLYLYRMVIKSLVDGAVALRTSRVVIRN